MSTDQMLRYIESSKDTHIQEQEFQTSRVPVP